MNVRLRIGLVAALVILIYSSALAAAETRIHIILRAFIPKEHPGNPGYVMPLPNHKDRFVIPAPLNLPTPLKDTCFATDDRLFDSNVAASSRATIEFNLTVDTSVKTARVEKVEGRDIHRVGLTSAVDCKTGQTVQSGYADTSDMHVGTPAFADGIAQVVVDLRASNPLFVKSPDIQTGGIFTFDTHTNELRFKGSTASFPAYEAYASLDGGPVVPIFRSMPASNTTVWNLIDFGSGLKLEAVDASITLPTIMDGIWTSDDVTQRFELRVNANKCAFTERAEDGASLTRTVALIREDAPDNWTIRRANDEAVLTFLGFSPPVRAAITAEAPEPSFLRLRKSGDTLSGVWKGISIRKDSRGRVSQIVPPSAAPEKVFRFLRVAGPLSTQPYPDPNSLAEFATICPKAKSCDTLLARALETVYRVTDFRPLGAAYTSEDNVIAAVESGDGWQMIGSASEERVLVEAQRHANNGRAVLAIVRKRAALIMPGRMRFDDISAANVPNAIWVFRTNDVSPVINRPLSEAFAPDDDIKVFVHAVDPILATRTGLERLDAVERLIVAPPPLSVAAFGYATADLLAPDDAGDYVRDAIKITADRSQESATLSTDLETVYKRAYTKAAVVPNAIVPALGESEVLEPVRVAAAVTAAHRSFAATDLAIRTLTTVSADRALTSLLSAYQANHHDDDFSALLNLARNEKSRGEQILALLSADVGNLPSVPSTAPPAGALAMRLLERSLANHAADLPEFISTVSTPPPPTKALISVTAAADAVLQFGAATTARMNDVVTAEQEVMSRIIALSKSARAEGPELTEVASKVNFIRDFISGAGTVQAASPNEAKLIAAKLGLATKVDELLGNSNSLLDLAGKAGVDANTIASVRSTVSSATAASAAVQAVIGGNYLTAVNAISGMFGAGDVFGGGRDNGAEEARHMQIMSALNELLAGQQQMKESLARLEEGQMKILKGQAEIMNELLQFRREVEEQHRQVMDQLAALREDVLINRELQVLIAARPVKTCQTFLSTKPAAAEHDYSVFSQHYVQNRDVFRQCRDELVRAFSVDVDAEVDPVFLYRNYAQRYPEATSFADQFSLLWMLVSKQNPEEQLASLLRPSSDVVSLNEKIIGPADSGAQLPASVVALGREPIAIAALEKYVVHLLETDVYWDVLENDGAIKTSAALRLTTASTLINVFLNRAQELITAALAQQSLLAGDVGLPILYKILVAGEVQDDAVKTTLLAMTDGNETLARNLMRYSLRRILADDQKAPATIVEADQALYKLKDRLARAKGSLQMDHVFLDIPPLPLTASHAEAVAYFDHLEEIRSRSVELHPEGVPQTLRWFFKLRKATRGKDDGRPVGFTVMLGHSEVAVNDLLDMHFTARTDAIARLVRLQIGVAEKLAGRSIVRSDDLPARSYRTLVLRSVAR